MVHAEIQQLQDKVSELNKLAEKYSKDKVAGDKEIERLKQDLSSTMAARDKYRQESQGSLEVWHVWALPPCFVCVCLCDIFCLFIYFIFGGLLYSLGTGKVY